MKWFKRLFQFIILVVLLVAGIISFVSWKYSDDLKSFAIETIRSVIVTKADFDEDVIVSFWSDFPLVAVELNNISIEDSFGTDTLLKLDKAFVQFNLVKLIQNEITIEGIRVTDGFIKLRRDTESQWNFRVWKEPDTKEPNRKTDFSIDVLVLENVHLDYDDRAVDLNIQYRSDKSKIRGRFSNDNQRLGLSLNGHLYSLMTAGAERIKQLPLELAGVLNINNKEKIYTIETGNAVLAGNEMVLDAEWKSLDYGTDMQMQVHAGNIEPRELLPLVWPQIPDNIRNLELTGKSDLIFTLNGPFKLNSGPKLDATIRMRDGSFNFQNTDITNLNFEGKLLMEDIKRSKAMTVNFEAFDLRTPSGQVSGSGSLTNLNNPVLKLKTKGKTQITELIQVASIQDEMNGSGTISWNIDFNGPLGKEFNTTVNELKRMNWNGSISLIESNLNFDTGMPELSQFNANISMNQGKTSITNCDGKLGHLAFDGSVDIADLKRILTDEKAPVFVSGNVHISEVDITKLPEEWKFESESKSSNERQVELRVDAKFDNVLYNSFSAQNFSGKMVMRDNEVTIDDLTLEALGGQISSSLTYSPNSLGYLLSLDADLQNVNISRALREWDNFEQTSITADNLRGTANITLEADIQLNKTQEILMDKLRVEANTEVGGGELIDFEPLMAMSRFIDVDELRNVQFDTLRNQLSIRNNKLIIPRMSVSSNILNVDVFGEHGFNQEMDYHVNLLLNDILRRKQKKTKSFDGHEIIDKKGKTRLFLWIRGTPDDIKVGFDKREVRKKLKEDFKKEGQTIKKLFKDEFGGNKNKDTEVEEETIDFRLEDNGIYEEDELPSEPDQPANSNKKEKKKKRGFFSTDEEEQETEGGFEIEFDP